MLKALLESKRSIKRSISLIYDALSITFALYLSISLRLGTPTFEITNKELITFFITISISLVAFIKLGLYRAILRYMAIPAVVTILTGVCISALALASSSFFTHSFIPRSSPFIYIPFALFLIGTPRLLIRSIVNTLYCRNKNSAREPIIIYGAGYSGHQLALSLQTTHYKPVAFVDDDPKLKGNQVAALTVYRPKHLTALTKKHSVKKVLLALSDTPRSRRSNIINQLEQLGIIVQTIPALPDILSGKAKINDIKDVEIDDLLGRDPVSANPDLLNTGITDKVIMVTGAGGSIGSELCRQIIQQKPKTLLLFELNEYSLYALERELRKAIAVMNVKIELISLIGSVQKGHRLETIMETFNVQTVYHAAAYKHVPLVEHNIVEGVRNNVYGTLYCAEAAIKANVESFVLISTDKAVRPTNIMGASKRVAELALQGLSQKQNKTRFTMVRFGNVLGSSGSVVPLFRDQIKSGGPVTVTHPDITRYFMTIPEAAELVIQAGSMGLGGDVFVLDMGEPVRIIDLATRMIHLSGLEVKDRLHPDGDIKIEFTGLRPGEKLYEELLVSDNVSGTEHPRIMRAEECSLSWDMTEKLLQNLDKACHLFQCDTVCELLRNAPSCYTPLDNKLRDNVWQAKVEQSVKRPKNVIILKEKA